jgi:4-methyl-5(b-hydroxyethyl)-thiazole monophosphate biosynthesis
MSLPSLSSSIFRSDFIALETFSSPFSPIDTVFFSSHLVRASAQKGEAKREAKMSKRVLVPISTGFEEIEALTVVDILNRAGASVVLAGLVPGPVTGRSKITVIPDMDLDAALAAEPYELVVLPGGLPNAYTLRDDPRIIALLKESAANNKEVAAICAAPAALEKAGLLAGIPATGHPSCESDLRSARYSEARVVQSGNVTTSRSAGTAMEFAFSLVRTLFGEEKVREVNIGVLATGVDAG